MKHISYFMTLLISMLALALSYAAPAYAQSSAMEAETPAQEPTLAPAVVIKANEPQDQDPLETLNRGLFQFNETVDGLFLEPAAKTYRGVVPPWGRERVGNVLDTLSAPNHLINSVLQGDVEAGFTAFWRFFINVTLGIGGLFGVATGAGLEAKRRDFGQTLAVYGVNQGPYLMVPLMGPNHFRDLVGKAVDGITNPFSYVSTPAVIAINVTDVVHTREGLIEAIDEIYETSFDPYSAIRSAYAQRRAEEIARVKREIRATSEAEKE